MLLAKTSQNQLALFCTSLQRWSCLFWINWGWPWIRNTDYVKYAMQLNTQTVNTASHMLVEKLRLDITSYGQEKWFRFISTWCSSLKCGHCGVMGGADFAFTTSVVEMWRNTDSHKKNIWRQQAQGSFYSPPPSALDVILANCWWDTHIVTPHIRTQQVPLSAAKVVLLGCLCRAVWRSVSWGMLSMGDGFNLLGSMLIISLGNDCSWLFIHAFTLLQYLRVELQVKLEVCCLSHGQFKNVSNKRKKKLQ